MNASEMRAALQPKADQLADSEAESLKAYSASPVFLRANRRRLAKQRAEIVQAELTEEANKLGLSVGIISWFVLKFVISQLANEIMKWWLYDNRSNPVA